MVSSNSFIVLALVFKSLIHFEIIFVYGIRFNFVILLVNIQFSQHNLKILLQNIVDLQCWVNFRCAAKRCSYKYTHIYSFRFFSHTGYYRVLSRVPRATKQILIDHIYLLYIYIYIYYIYIYFIYSNVYVNPNLLIYSSPLRHHLLNRLSFPLSSFPLISIYMVQFFLSIYI